MSMDGKIIPSSSNKRIAKNTLILYVRWVFVIAINLYTVRLLWKVLGIENYGIYNVVGGIVLMFAFLNNAMISSSQRFITFALGKSDIERLQKTFSISVSVHIFLAILVLLLGETIGLWFLNFKLNIPSNRIYAANWVYQSSVLVFIINMISVPYNACIVAHERMKIFGYFGILDVLLKLLIVIILSYLPFDKLVSYSLLFLMEAICMRSLYTFYCRRNFVECHYKRHKDNKLIKEMFSFAGWSFVGNMGISIRDQGLNILINIFFNVTVNAAKGIANQVGAAINTFASSFTMALNPQITKRYASGDFSGMINLVFRGCKYTFLLMSIIIIPLIFCIPDVLKLWLTDVAQYTVGFVQLILILALVECVTSPIVTALQASGKIKKFQIIIACLMLFNIPLSWIGLKLITSPYVIMYVSICVSTCALITRLMLLHEIVKYDYYKFFSCVYERTIPISLLSCFVCYHLYAGCSNSFWGLVAYEVISIGIMIILGITIGLTKREKRTMLTLILNKLHKN